MIVARSEGGGAAGCLLQERGRGVDGVCVRKERSVGLEEVEVGAFVQRVRWSVQ